MSFNEIRYFYTLDANLFDIIIIDKCLQKIENFYSIFENAKRTLKNNGELILVLPDYRLYEKCLWPSKFNKNHMHSFSMNLTREIVKRDTHWHIEENLIPLMKNFQYDHFQSNLDDNNFDYDKPVLEDQTKEGAACFVIVKCNIIKELNNE
jgi:SAM-dependent methyltransferase